MVLAHVDRLARATIPQQHTPFLRCRVHAVAEIAGLEKSTSPLKTCSRCGKSFQGHIEDADEIKDFCTPCLQEMNKKLEIGKGSGPGASMN
jgi:hypothetical protein